MNVVINENQKIQYTSTIQYFCYMSNVFANMSNAIIKLESLNATFFCI